LPCLSYDAVAERDEHAVGAEPDDVCGAVTGDVDVENSNGMISLVTTTGNILVFESRPSEVGDIFKARTNGGKISLQNLQHRQVEVNSTTGSIQFMGSLLDGGIYNLLTQMQISQNAARQNTISKLNQMTDVESALKEAERKYLLNKKLYDQKVIGKQEYESSLNLYNYQAGRRKLSEDILKQDGTSMKLQVAQAKESYERMAGGVSLLENNPMALEAFKNSGGSTGTGILDSAAWSA
jgi:hypothetical protein